MECVNKNCTVVNDRMVTCWLCLGFCHLKCSGLRARDADALEDKSKNLQWSCPNCRIVGVEFYNFFKSYKADFDDIKNNFLALQCKLEKYGELFSKFKNLENFTVSPKRKRKVTSKQTSSNSSSSPANSKKPDMAQISNSNQAVVSNESSETNPSDNILNRPQQLQVAVQPLNAVYNLSQNINSPELIVFSPNLPSNSELVQDPTTSQQTNQSLPVTNPKPLRVIPILKTIFASRFAVDTSVLDVECFIKNKISQDFHKDIKIFKINARNRASFKIIVPDVIFDNLVDTNF